MPGMDLWGTLPNRVFVSHAYADKQGVRKLVRRLPANVEPVIFPRLDADPKRAVSDGIVPAIVSCPALIYLEGGKSAESPWVNFERDYGLRSGRRVLAFDPVAGTLEEPKATPVPLRVQLFVGEGDEERAARLLAWMKSERSFEFDAEPTFLRLKELPIVICDLIRAREIAVWLMGKNIGAAASVAYEVPVDLLAETCDDPARDEADYENFGVWLDDHSMYVRLTPDWQPIEAEDAETREFILSEYPVERAFHSGWAVDLVSKDESDIDWNRADDLIVRLTLMVRQTWPFFDDEEDEEDDEDDDDW